MYKRQLFPLGTAPKAEGDPCGKPAATIADFLTSIDYVPPSIQPSSGRAQLILLEDNDAVIKMIIKGRSPAMRHVVRTHRVDLDWLFERIRDDPGINIRFIGTKYQLADILTKGQFTGEQWTFLVRLCQIVDVNKLVKNPIRREVGDQGPLKVPVKRTNRPMFSIPTPRLNRSRF